MDKNRLEEIRARTKAAARDVPDLLDALAEAQAEIEQLRKAAGEAAAICRLQRKSWDCEIEDVKAYASWTRWIDHFEKAAGK